MSRCDAKVEVGRRQFLRGAGVAAVTGAATATMRAPPAEAKPSLSRVSYPSAKLGNLKDLKVNVAAPVAYPDKDAPGVLIKLGQKVPGGAGPDGDIVGFTTVCPHKGFPLAYNDKDKTLNCPGHYGRFDCENGGQQIFGHATQNLAQYTLRIEANGDIIASGIDELLYGRLSNVL